jgi:acetyl-CoA synthetase
VPSDRAEEADALPSPERFRQRARELALPVPDAYNIAAATCDRWAEGGRVAMVDLGGAEPRVWSFEEFRSQSRRLAHGLAGLGVTKGSRVAILLPQGAAAATAHLAVYRLGAIAVPLATIHGSDALGHRIEDSGPVVGVTDLDSWARLDGTDLALACRWVVTDGLDDETIPSSLTSLAETIAQGSDRPVDVTVQADTPAMIVYTSGTTGMPKGAVHAHRVVAAHAGPIRLAHDEFPCDRDLLWSPADWAWAGGLIDCLLSAWHAGVPIVAFRGRGFDPDQVMEMMATHAVRNTFLPPTALKMLLAASPGQAEGLDLRTIMTGGEPVARDIIDASVDAFGVVPNAVYGQTEASCLVGSSSGLLPVRPGAMGMPYPGYDIDLLDDDGHSADQGEVAVRGEAAGMFLGYWRQPEATDAKYRHGCLMTGDLARRDEDGYLWFVARADDIIISAGYRIGPAEIEACLERDPNVRAAAAVGVPDAERGQVIRAVVELAVDVDDTDSLADELSARVRRELAPYEVPREFEFVAELPRTTTGKLSRVALRDAAPSQSTEVTS